MGSSTEMALDEKVSVRQQKSGNELARDILELEGDPAFQKLSRELTKTNFFRILGSSKSETWHSSFWGWVFDPEGSHGLEGFAVNRLLSLAAEDNGDRLRCVRLGRRLGDKDGWDNSRSTAKGRTQLTVNDLMSFEVEESLAVPGRRTDHSEVEIDYSSFQEASRDRCRFDILLMLQGAEFDGDNKNQNINILVGIECKVDAKYKPDQLRDYSRWLHANPSPGFVSNPKIEERLDELLGRIRTNPGGIFSFGFFLAKNRPEDRKGKRAPEALEPSWTSITYNTLIEYVLEPMLEHPGLDEAAGSLIRQYIEMSSSPTSDIFTGSTQMHTELVEKLLERHEETFRVIATVLEEKDETQDIGSTLNQTVEDDGRTKSLTPQHLIQHVSVEPGDELVHKPMKKRDHDNEPPFEEEVVARIVEYEGEGSGRSSLEWVSGGGHEIDGLHSASGLLSKIYKAHGSNFTANGNAYWKFRSGEYEGQSLVEVYDQCREVMSD
jgi:hypothetical protein